MRFQTILIFSSLVLFFFTSAPVQGQECGPGCPACSGKAIGDLLPPRVILGSALCIPDGEEETAVLTLRYGLFPWLDAGIGYALDAEETIWSVRAQSIAQDREGWRPALILGTGSVQAGGSDQSGYVQIVKTLEIIEGVWGITVAGGYATDLPDLEEDWGLGTSSITLFDRLSPFYTYDGVNSHVGLSFFATEWLTLTGFVLEMEETALAASIQWDLGEKEEE